MKQRDPTIISEVFELITKPGSKSKTVSGGLRRAAYYARYGELFKKGMETGKWRPLIRRICIDLAMKI